MGQTCCAHNRATLAHVPFAQFGVAFDEPPRCVIAQRTAHTGHFEAVGKAVVDEDAAWKRKHLGLVLKAAEGCREDEAVVVAVEFGAVVCLAHMEFLLP